MEKPIYPEVKTKQNDDLLEMETHIRISHEGIWYSRKITVAFYFTNKKEFESHLLNICNDFHKEVYHSLVFANPFKWEIDDNQISEADRLIRYIKPSATTPPTSTRPDVASSEGHTDK